MCQIPTKYCQKMLNIQRFAHPAVDSCASVNIDNPKGNFSVLFYVLTCTLSFY